MQKQEDKKLNIRNFVRKRKKIIIAIVAVLLLWKIVNFVNAYKIVHIKNEKKDPKEAEKIIKLPRFINGINSLPLVFRTSSPLMGELFGGINQYPLHVACFRDNYKIAEMLVKRGADVNKIDPLFNQDPPLFKTLASEENENRFKIAKLLIQHGANIDYENLANEVALTLCLKQSYYIENRTKKIKKEQMEVFIYLLKNCKSLEVPRYEDYLYAYTSLLDATIVYDNREAMEYLLDKGYFSEADIPRVNGSQLSYLAKRAKLDIFKMFFDLKDINAKDEKGRTPLINAVIGYKTETCEFLIENGADINIKDNDGKTAYDYSKKNLDERRKKSWVSPEIRELNNELRKKSQHS